MKCAVHTVHVGGDPNANGWAECLRPVGHKVTSGGKDARNKEIPGVNIDCPGSGLQARKYCAGWPFPRMVKDKSSRSVPTAGPQKAKI